MYMQVEGFEHAFYNALATVIPSEIGLGSRLIE